MKHVFVWTIKDIVGLGVLGLFVLALIIGLILALIEGRKTK